MIVTDSKDDSYFESLDDPDDEELGFLGTQNP